MSIPMVGIIGAGAVGSRMQAIFPWAIIYDKYKDEYADNKWRINKSAAISFVCVPTPMNGDGSCDISAVEEVVDWLESDIIVIKSTVPVGTTDMLIKRTGKRIC